MLGTPKEQALGAGGKRDDWALWGTAWLRSQATCYLEPGMGWHGLHVPTESSLGDIHNTNPREGEKELQLIVSVEERATEKAWPG